MSSAPAPAKLNLALVAGPLLEHGKHELATVFQRIALADRIVLEPAPVLEVDGFPTDTIVRHALETLAREAGAGHSWRVAIDKKIPVAAGLAGGSSDAATALKLANDTLAEPLAEARLLAIASGLGADVSFFLTSGPQLGRGDGSQLNRLELPQNYEVLLLLPAGVTKPSTAEVYRAFDRRDGARGFAGRKRSLLIALEAIEAPSDLAGLPANDLAASPLSGRLLELGAFRADVTGAGPALFGLFERRAEAEAAARALSGCGMVWLTRPAW